MEYGLSKRSRDILLKVFRSFPGIEEAVVYRSRATGTYREGSDIDITLKGKLSFEELLRIENELDDEMLAYTVDLSIYDSLNNAALREHIDREGKSLYFKTSGKSQETKKIFLDS